MREVTFYTATEGEDGRINTATLMPLKDVGSVDIVDGCYGDEVHLETREGLNKFGAYLGEVASFSQGVPEIVIEDGSYVLIFNKPK